MTSGRPIMTHWGYRHVAAADKDGMTIIAYTDGSALANPHGPAGWSWWVSDQQWAAGGFQQASNQHAELFAILAALRGIPADLDLLIRSDSQYSIDCVTKWIKNWKRNGWVNASKQPVKNASLIKSIDANLTARAGTVRFEKVKGHSGDRGNDRADQLCTAASRAIQVSRPITPGPGWDA